MEEHTLKPSSYKPTSFSGFLSHYPFNVNHTLNIYPLHIRETDDELDIEKDPQKALDKAMTMLSVAEGQVNEMITPYPFDPEDFGFEAKEVSPYGVPRTVYEIKSNSLSYLKLKGEYTTVLTKDDDTPGVWRIFVDFQDGTEDGPLDRVFETNLFLPNHHIAQIVLRSLGVIPMIEEHKPMKEPTHYEVTFKLKGDAEYFTYRGEKTPAAPGVEVKITITAEEAKAGKLTTEIIVPEEIELNTATIVELFDNEGDESNMEQNEAATPDVVEEKAEFPLMNPDAEIKGE